jgi:SNF2 family DNA or RNA helicase
MGLGKTVQVIAYLTTLDRSKNPGPSLVVCPASLILNWGEELRRFGPELHAALFMGNAAERKSMMETCWDADVWVTSYELLRQDIAAYAKKEFYCCILDEGQHIKNRTTQVSKAVKQLVCRQRFVLTGTPIENRLSELWNLFDFLMPGYLFSHGTFVEKLEKPMIKSKSEEAGEQLKRLVQPFMLRRLKKDVLKELPPKIEYTRLVPLSETERKTYLSAVYAAKTNLGDSKLQILAALTQLRQVCCDPNLCFENYQGPTSKLEACLELCAGMVENGHQILLFSQFTSMLDRIRPRLEELGISSFTLQGSTPKKKRAELVKAFNAGGASVFLISLKAGGTGLNLTAADVVIHYDPWWNLAAQNQATDRAHRIGQSAHVQVYKLIAKDTIEEKILELQEKKWSLMDAVSGSAEGSILDMTKEELLKLLD